jgi:hypothetical protein
MLDEMPDLSQGVSIYELRYPDHATSQSTTYIKIGHMRVGAQVHPSQASHDSSEYKYSLTSPSLVCPAK